MTPITEFVCVDIGTSFLVLLFKKTLYVAKALLLQFQSQVLFNLTCFGYHLGIQNRELIIDLQKNISSRWKEKNYPKLFDIILRSTCSGTLASEVIAFKRRGYRDYILLQMKEKSKICASLL